MYFCQCECVFGSCYGCVCLSVYISIYIYMYVLMLIYIFLYVNTCIFIYIHADEGRGVYCSSRVGVVYRYI